MDAQNMSNSFNNLLPNFGDATVEPVPTEDSHRVPEKVPPDDEAQSSQKMMNNHQPGIEDGSEDSNGDASESGRKKKIEPMKAEEMDEDRGEGSADDMDLDETIDSHIGVRMESERRHHLHSLPSDNEEIDEDDDMGMDSVNILDTLPLEGAPIEGQEVSEADLLGKMNEDDDEDEDKSVSRSGEEDEREVGKRSKSQDDDSEHAKKKSKNDEDKDGAPELESKSDKKSSNMRRNIREVMDETQLDEATLAAQRQEMERLRRVQEQQRIIREVQRRQFEKGVSLLRSNQNLQDSEEIRLPSSVQLRVNSTAASGSQMTANQANLAPRRPLGETSRWQRGQTSLSRLPGRTEASTNAALQQRIRMMTPSVSISPVVSKKEPIEHLEYYTDSDLSDVEDIEETDEYALQEKQMQQARKLSGPPKPPKSKDVVTISSSSEEVEENSDDDCIVLSDPSDSEEGDAEDDPSNSGMHTNDRYNIPDDQGRVLVNVGHPENEPDVFLAPQIARIIKPHQIGGIRFLFDNIIESIDRYKTSAGFGCILAHSMGLGKTLQVATFCDIFFRCTDAKTVLCIMPINTLQNWLAEFNMWLPYENPEKPKAEEKPVIKEETTSRSGMEGNHEQMGQHQNPAGMMMDSPYPSYNPHYGAPPGGMYDPRYSSGYPGAAPGYPQVKTEPSCHPQQMNPYGVPQYPPNPNYPQSMQHHPQYPPNMHQTPNYPNMDPNMHPGMHNPSGQMYPGYGTQPNAPYPNYGGQPVPNDPNVKKEDDGSLTVKTEGNLQAKEDPNKEAEEPKKDGTEEQKEKINTPFSVDAPPDLEIRPRHFNLHILNDSHKTMAARARVIDEWQRVGGVLLIGYELYRQLSLKKQNKAKRKRGQPFKDPDVEEENKNKPLLEKMHTALVNPGPDLVICDEGHRIKNSHASISLALKQMRTKRRIVLTGYPLQNNLLEYWCMVDFVRPNYLGTKSEFCNMFERPIQNGQCVDSTPQDIRLMRYRAHVLHSLLVGFVQRRSHTVLQISLPRKEEFILLVRMTPHQRKLYDVFMNEVVKKRTVPNPLKAFAVCCKIWNHPDVLYHFLKKRQANEEDDLDLEETIGDKATAAGGKRATKPRQPKGDGKRGRKPKNKPAASIQPNSMGDSKNLEADAPKPQAFPNFNAAPVPAPTTNANPGFQNPNVQNNYQQPGDYQNYQNRPDDRPPTTGNYQSGDYYANQNQQSQQKYPPVGGQNFSTFPQDSNYHPTNTPQQFQGQPQNYNSPPSDANSNANQRYSGGSNPSNYQIKLENQPMGASSAPGGFTQSNYPYQDQSKNYPPNPNQDPNCQQVPNQQQQQQQQQPNYPPQNQASNYGSYPPQNQNQGYNSNVPQNNSVNYQSNAQQPQNPNASPATNMYMNNQQQTSNPPPNTNTPGYPQNQQMVNSGSQPFQNMNAQPNQNAPYSMNQRENANPASGPSTEVSFNQNQQSSQQPHAYQASNAQNQMGGYQDASQKPPANYNQFGLTQPHAYSNDQQQQQQQQQHGYNQQNSANNYPPTNQQSQGQTGQMSYPPNQATPSSGTSEIPHGFQANSQQNQNQSVNYPQNEQQGSFPGSDPQKAPSHENNYSTGGQNVSQNFSTGSSQNSSSNQTVDNQQQQQQMGVPGHDQYWQRNYQNSNNSYPTDSNVNQYDRNYSTPGTMPGNYQTNPPSQINQQSKDFSVNTLTDNKPQMEYGQPKNEHPGTQNQTAQQQSNPMPGGLYNNSNNVQGNPGILEPPKDLLEKDKDVILEKGKDEEIDDDLMLKDESEKDKFLPGGLAGMMGNIKEEPGIPYDWAVELMKGYIPGLIDASTKMTLFFCILEESIRRGDRILTFSQSLFTLDLIEDFLARNSLKHDSGETENWAKNVNYFRLDGSTSALEREKLINEFNANKKIHLFLVSTRAGSLGINLVGANRAIVFDASWNPCHDTQAVCRVYRYGQKKNCYVYRLVTDNCLERKIYDRQINKQGMADRVVDQCNPDAHLSLKEAATLSWDWEEDKEEQDFSGLKDKYTDEVMHVLLDKHSKLLTKEPFHHESLLVDRKERKLSQAEKKLARRGYEMEKMAATNSKPSYNYIPGNTATRVSVSGGLQIRQIRGEYANQTAKPVASVRPMQQRGTEGSIGPRNPSGTRWIPAEVWQRQGMSAQEMTLPLDVVIPTNSPDKGSIVLKAGQKVMVLKSPKGIYMQLESGKIIAIRTALKINQQKKDDETPKKSIAPVAPRTGNSKPDVGFPLRNNSAISIIPKTSTSNVPPNRPAMRTGVNYRPFGEKEVAKRTKPIATAAAKPYSNQMNSSQVTLSRINKPKHDNPSDVSSIGENSNSSDGHRVRADQRVEEIGVEDLVGESGSNSDYSPSSKPSNSDTDSNLHRPMMESRVMPNYPLDTSPVRSQVMRTPQESYMPEPNTSFAKKFDQKGILGQKDKKPELIGKDPMMHQYPHQPFNPHQQVQQHHAIPQPIVPQHQHMQPQQPQQLQQTQHRPQHPYQQQPPQQMMPQQQPPQQQQLQQTPHPQMQRLQQPQPVPQQTQQPRQPAARNPPRPMLQRKNQSKSTPKNAPPVAVQTLDHSPSPNASSRSKPPSVESVGSQSNEAPEGSLPVMPPQGYPYAQYPRYYDYEDPRSRPLAESYPPYYPSTLPPPEHSQTSLELQAKEPKPSIEPSYPRVPTKNSAATEAAPKTSKPAEAGSGPGEESHVPTAFSHPSRSASAYPGSYPPAPYDPYAQHYPPAPASSTAYGAPAPAGYGAMYGGGPMPYDPHMYSHHAFPPPPAAASDPYRGYAPPPSSAPNPAAASSNYYSAFPAPPPPYPNYSFLPPYPNPNVPAAEQPQPPPAQ